VAKILVIDDETILRNEVIDWLTFEGHEVIPAENGLVGVERAIEWLPDLIICDVTLPYLDGFGALLEIHSNAALAQTPFIFVTARATHDDIRYGMTLGADDYVTKPFTRMQILEAVQSQLEKFAARERIYQQEMLQLQNALAQEQEQRLLKTRLIAMFSHDFRNPLASILSSTNLLITYADKVTPERRFSIHNRIESSVKQLLQMLDDMLVVSQMESGHLNFIPERIDVGAVFEQIVEEFQNTTGDTYTIVFENRVTSPAMADVRLLRQMGLNLISNAIKYSPRGSTVRVTLNVDEQNYVLVVEDQGIGISEDDQKRLFEPFERGKNVGDIAGTGLGLAIVKRAIELYGGSIRIESTLNQGTSMIVTFPIHPTCANDISNSQLVR
jgi:signal transduction histidine kinase